MKKTIFVLLLISAVSVFAQTQQPVNLKVGYVDSEIIMTQFSEAIKAKSDLEGFVAKWRKEADSMGTVLQNAYADYQKQASTMKPEQQREAQTKIVEKEQELQKYRDQKFGQPNGEYFVRQESLLAPVKEKIFKAIDEIAKEENMHYVLDKAGEVVVLYADSQFDITFKVLDRLKRGK
ncbi:MAG TPA: OmpH family outer membrane protein [Melioribacteraceae bacterium]|nr:OmpH family outer membrane protein [Melioribacteraceae bacterium]